MMTEKAGVLLLLLLSWQDISVVFRLAATAAALSCGVVFGPMSRGAILRVHLVQWAQHRSIRT